MQYSLCLQPFPSIYVVTDSSDCVIHCVSEWAKTIILVGEDAVQCYEMLRKNVNPIMVNHTDIMPVYCILSH